MKKTIFNIQNLNGTASGNVQHMVINYASNDLSSKSVHLTTQKEEGDTRHPTPNIEKSCNMLLPNKYAQYITTNYNIDAIGKRLVYEANNAATKQQFVVALEHIVKTENNFRFIPTLSNAKKAQFCNMILAEYGYQGNKCKNITLDDFARHSFVLGNS